ncbi:MAG: tripartite tricarboxylate transporter TctB family protein [Betaproteobacteria bacterium]|nr:tripartite tricarboxylate transporter TctB family protein [Betaproteobacteria bacterium]
MPVLLKLRRIAPYAIILALSGYLYDLALHFDYQKVPGRIGPDAWPRIILVLLMAICAYQVLRLALQRKTGEVEGVLQSLEEEAAPSLVHPETEHPWLAWAGIALTFGYLLAFERVGFFSASFVYLFLLMLVGGYRRVLTALGIALAASLAFMFVFMKIVYVSLPLGRGPFLDVSIGVMKVLGIH